MSIGLNYEEMYAIYSKEFAKNFTFDYVLQDTEIYLKAGFDKQSAQVCAYSDSKLAGACAAIIMAVEANNAKIEADISLKFQQRGWRSWLRHIGLFHQHE